MPTPVTPPFARTVASPHPAVALSNRPLYSLLVQFPAVCFVGALVTDIAYWKTTLFLWETFSVWLLAAGCVMAGFAGLVGLFHFATDRRVRAARFAGAYALVSFVAALIAVVNAFVHSRDGYTAVVPDGLALSTIVVVLMLVAALLARARPSHVSSYPGVAA